jgi:phosphatidylinositol alpha-1,6-mannosyltransferase
MSSDILLVSELFPPAVGGSAALLANVYGRVKTANVTVLLDPVASGPAVGTAPSLPHEWVRIDGRHRGILSSSDTRQVGRVARAISTRTRGKGAVVVHAARPLPEGLPALAARCLTLGRVRYVCWAHGEEVAAALTSREHAFLARRVCSSAATVIASSGFASRLVARLGVPPERIRIVYPGVDAARFGSDVDATEVPTRLTSKPNPTLLSVGRLQRRKGHDIVIGAVALLRADFPTLQYVIAGDGQERGRLEALVHEHGLEQHVSFLGAVSDDQLPGLYAACDIFLMPTRQDGPDVEGFGIVFLEAAASGKPAIGGRNGGVPEAIAEGETGLLVEGHDCGELAHAIRTLASSPTLRATMGAAGRRRVLQSFTWDRAARQVEALHRELSSDT